jgi:hypothetical protein
MIDVILTLCRLSFHRQRTILVLLWRVFLANRRLIEHDTPDVLAGREQIPGQSRSCAVSTEFCRRLQIFVDVYKNVH